MYENLRKLKGVPKLKLQKQIDALEQRIEWQGANPKQVDFDDLKEHIRDPAAADDHVEAKYKKRISSRATAIRAYCVWCQGSDTAAVRLCESLTCPLHPYRMGTDPLRGFEMPVMEFPEIEIEDDADDDLFEDDDTGDTDDKE